MNFNELGLCPQILSALAAKGYEAPSPIQERSIPAVLAGRDLLGCAQTGSGKTAAFALPILQLLWQKGAGKKAPRKIRALILTPTRELALQIQENFQAYGRSLPLRSTVIMGGVNQNPQIAELKRGQDILIATPGRLNDLINQGHLSLDSVEIFVLDEADRMLDMGFINDVKKVIRQLPPRRQNLLFSATLPAEILALIDSMLHDYVKVMVSPEAPTVEKIQQSLYFVDKQNKAPLLCDLLKEKRVPSALVFTRTKHGADKLVRYLLKAGIAAQAIHGNKSQNARQSALDNFKIGKTRILVATDIAARGIDIDSLPYVFNYDLSNEPEVYVHRIGRTGRAGNSGTAISFCSAEERPLLKDIEKLILKRVPVVENHSYPAMEEAPVKQPAARQAAARPAQIRPRQQTEPKPEQRTRKPKVGGSAPKPPRADRTSDAAAMKPLPAEEKPQARTAVTRKRSRPQAQAPARQQAKPPKGQGPVRAELTPQAKPQPQALPPASEASRPQPNRRRRGPRPGAGRAAGGSRPANEA